MPHSRLTQLLTRPTGRFAKPARRRRTSEPRHQAADVLEARTMLSAVPMTAAEQYFVELVNRARLDPQGEAARLGTPLNDGGTSISSAPKQALATHVSLAEAAEAHSGDMLDRNYFSHTAPSPDPFGSTPSDRAQTFGYDGVAGENIAYRGSSGPVDLDTAMVDRLHQDFWESKGHRSGMMADDNRLREVGIGLVRGRFTSRGSTFNTAMVTEKFGYSNSGRLYITGVVYDDADSGAGNNEFYDIGEGVGGGSIAAVNVSTGQTIDGGINGVGGYNIEVGQPGTYDVVLRQGGQTYTIDSVSVGGANAKVDFDFDEITADPPSTGPNTAPTIVGSTFFTVPEDAVRGTFVGRVQADDPDAGQSLSWNVGSAAFDIDDRGRITVADPNRLDILRQPRMRVRATVTDNGSPALSDSERVVIEITAVPGANRRPQVQAADFTVSRDASRGTFVGRVQASDPNPGDTLRFSIRSAAFAIDPQTGRITVAQPSRLQGKNEFQVRVIAADDGDPRRTGSALITIRVTDLGALI